MCSCNKIQNKTFHSVSTEGERQINQVPTFSSNSRPKKINSVLRKSSCCCLISQCYTSQLPKPVECIEVENKDHYFVPPVKIDGKIVTNFQYLSLHDIDRFFNDKCILKRNNNEKILRNLMQLIHDLFANCVRKNQNEYKELSSLSLDDLYKETFRLDSVKDLNKNCFNKKHCHTI